ncbi:hypothetical protein OKW43_008664 [Paraburkholderia sp. WC7.3g]|uniref:SpvB/TcaC N-terminal domain-containing protein n=1 Tax=Paraburkholderia sp. WC7.3g TaxID=2991070 RepID=UPI003D24F813
MANRKAKRDSNGVGDTRPPDSSIGVLSIALPKVGKATRGINENLSAEPRARRSDFGPQLGLPYRFGDGTFRIARGLFMPAITRNTDKGLPHNRDAEEPDVFILSRSEDLVPVFKKKPGGNWDRDDKRNAIIYEWVAKNHNNFNVGRTTSAMASRTGDDRYRHYTAKLHPNHTLPRSPIRPTEPGSSGIHKYCRSNSRCCGTRYLSWMKVATGIPQPIAESRSRPIRTAKCRWRTDQGGGLPIPQREDANALPLLSEPHFFTKWFGKGSMRMCRTPEQLSELQMTRVLRTVADTTPLPRIVETSRIQQAR